MAYLAILYAGIAGLTITTAIYVLKILLSND